MELVLDYNSLKTSQKILNIAIKYYCLAPQRDGYYGLITILQFCYVTILSSFKNALPASRAVWFSYD